MNINKDLSEPKYKLHYCWFGGHPKPPSVLNYIESWKKTLSDYEIIEWNESNFDIHCCQYVEEAYEKKKYAFVSDYARLFALYHHGGIYLDTDVEVCKSLTPLLYSGVLTFGFEEFNFVATSTIIAPKKSKFIKYFLESYHPRVFIKPDGSFDETTNVKVLTRLLEDIELKKNGSEQKLNYKGEDVIILSQLLLSPFDYINYIDKSNASTYTIHHFGQSWGDNNHIRNKKIKKIIYSTIGGRGLIMLRKFLT